MLSEIIERQYERQTEDFVSLTGISLFDEIEEQTTQ